MQFSMVFMRARRVVSSDIISDKEGFGVFWSPEAVGWCLVCDIISRVSETRKCQDLFLFFFFTNKYSSYAPQSHHPPQIQNSQ